MLSALLLCYLTALPSYTSSFLTCRLDDWSIDWSAAVRNTIAAYALIYTFYPSKSSVRGTAHPTWYNPVNLRVNLTYEHQYTYIS